MPVPWWMCTTKSPGTRSAQEVMRFPCRAKRRRDRRRRHPRISLSVITASAAVSKTNPRESAASTAVIVPGWGALSTPATMRVPIPAVDLRKSPCRPSGLVDGERSLLRIGRHRHVLDVHDLPVAVDERDGERDEGVLHPEPPALLLFKDEEHAGGVGQH